MSKLTKAQFWCAPHKTNHRHARHEPRLEPGPFDPKARLRERTSETEAALLPTPEVPRQLRFKKVRLHEEARRWNREFYLMGDYIASHTCVRCVCGQVFVVAQAVPAKLRESIGAEDEIEDAGAHLRGGQRMPYSQPERVNLWAAR